MAAGPNRRRLRPAYLIRTGLIVLVAAAALWFTFAVTLSNRLAQTAPSIAVAWWPGAEASANAAASLVQMENAPGDLTNVRAMAIAALRREPLNVSAVRTLVIVAAMGRDESRARRLLAYAEGLSRRDLPTQLMLIEDAVRRNDIPSALRNYDRALRTSPRSYDLLMPILVQASTEPPIARELALMMADRPPWWWRFLDRMNAESRAPASLALIVDRLRLDPSEATERHLLSNALTRLVALGDHRAALALYRRAVPHGGGDALLRNGDFETDGGIPPFGWLLTDEPGLSAVRQPAEGGGTGHALFLMADNGRSGEVARQLLLLSPGRYRIALTAGGIAGDVVGRPVIALTCAGAQGSVLGEVPLPDAPTTGTPAAGEFAVPAGCPAQFLSIRASSPLDKPDAGLTWIDNIVLTHL